MNVAQWRLIVIADQATLAKKWAPDEFLQLLDQTLAGVTPPWAASIGVMDREPGNTSTDATRLERLKRLRRITARHGAGLIVNGRSDLAVAVEADGVQLPERGLPASVVRRSYPGLMVGRSCHNRAGLEIAQADGAQWATLAPIYPPTSKALPAGQSPLGRSGWEKATEGLNMPVFALGGINPSNSGGYHRVAAIGAVWLSSSPLRTVQDFLRGFSHLTSRP